MSSHLDCNVPTAKINGRTLQKALLSTHGLHRFGKFSATEWVGVCPRCDAAFLAGSQGRPWPFLCADGVMRTVSDFHANGTLRKPRDMDFWGFRFSKSALESGIALIRQEDASTKLVEQAGSKIGSRSRSAALLNFSEMVCTWGRGQRVWANLIRHNSDDELGTALAEWVGIVSDLDDDHAAIEAGIAIKGLGVSFASKHLRMLNPKRFAVLDDVLSEGLGFALNVNGYKLFLRLLREFIASHNLDCSVSELEGGIFLLVRQNVRAKKPKAAPQP